jgi:hypothetical protein
MQLLATRLVLGVPAVICVLALGVIIAETFGKGFSYAEMDWNGDGWTSTGEILDAVDYGIRPDRKKTECREVFRHKDGLPVTLLCP